MQTYPGFPGKEAIKRVSVCYLFFQLALAGSHTIGNSVTLGLVRLWAYIQLVAFISSPPVSLGPLLTALEKFCGLLDSGHIKVGTKGVGISRPTILRAVLRASQFVRNLSSGQSNLT